MVTEAGTRLRRPLDAWFAVCGSIVVVLCSIVALDGVPEWERSIFEAINGLPDALKPVLYPFQLVGVVVVPLGIALIAYLLKWRRAALALVLLVPIKLILELKVIKVLVGRERPAASICNGDLTCGNFRDVPLAGGSFPSGHAIIAGGMLVILWPYLPKPWRIGAIVVALGICVARVYLGAHNPLDVTCGFAAGVAVGGILNLIVGVDPPARNRDPDDEGVKT
jgi:undecaprenyl-diphosphatase